MNILYLYLFLMQCNMKHVNFLVKYHIYFTKFDKNIVKKLLFFQPVLTNTFKSPLHLEINLSTTAKNNKLDAKCLPETDYWVSIWAQVFN